MINLFQLLFRKLAEHVCLTYYPCLSSRGAEEEAVVTWLTNTFEYTDKKLLNVISIFTS